MTAKTIPRAGAEVKALRIVLITLLILYGVVSVSSAFIMARVVPSLVNRPSGRLFLGSISGFCDRILPGVLFFFMAYSIFKLISLISRGEPFSPASPRYIRRVGYAVFGLAAANAVVDAISGFSRAGFLSEKIVWLLYRGLGTLLIAFGFLVIARVIEVGVRLQQDQNLTV